LVHNVSDDVDRGFRGSKAAIEVTLLPNPLLMLLAMALPDSSAESIRTHADVRRRLQSCEERVEMIGHEAVRNRFNSAFICSTQKFISDRIDHGRRREVATTLERVHREEDPHGADVLELGQTRRASVIHASDVARSMPLVVRSQIARLKPRAPFEDALG
jgi:hypothetical protein